MRGHITCDTETGDLTIILGYPASFIPRRAVVPSPRADVHSFSRASLAVLLAGLTAAGVSCGEDLTLPGQGVAAAIAIVSGDNQNGTVGAALDAPLVVRVTDAAGRPVGSQRVTFAVTTAGGGGGQVAPTEAQTDADGQASTRWVLGTTAGEQQVRAQVVGDNVPANLVVIFSASTIAAAPSNIAAADGNGQSGTAGSALPRMLVALVTDGSGNPVADVNVRWAAGNGGSVTASEVATGTDGRSSVTWTLGPVAGEQTATATVDGLTGSPVTFTATAQVGTAGRLTITTQPSAAAASGVPFARQPQLQLRDANGNPVGQAGVAVIAAISSSPAGASASLVGSTVAATNAAGLASFSGLGINGPAGTYVLNFSGTNLSGVNSAAVTIGAGAPVRTAFTVQPSNATVSAAISPAIRVQLQDAAGNLTPEDNRVTLVLDNNPTNASLGGTVAVNAVDGVATFSNVRVNQAGTGYTLSAQSSGLIPGTSAPFNIARAATSTAVTSSDPSSASGQSVTFTARVTSSAGTPSGSVQFIIDGNPAGSPVALDDGVARFSTSSLSIGTHTVAANYGGSANFAPSNGALSGGQTVGKANSTTNLTDNPATSVTGQDVSVTATVSAAGGAGGIPTGTVEVSGGGSTCTITLSGGTGTCTLRPGSSGDFTGTYGGDTRFNGSTGTEAHQVNNAGTTTTITGDSNDPSDFGESTNISVTVVVQAPGRGTPGGTVTVSGGSDNCTVTLSGGEGSCSLSPNASGSIAAAYNGDSRFDGSVSAAEPHTVNPAPTTTSVTSSQASTVFGEPVTFTAMVTSGAGTPTGAVQFTIDGTPSGGSRSLSGGRATLTASDLAAGPHTVAADYQGTSSFQASGGALPGGHNVARANTAIGITDDPDPSPFPGIPVNINVTVSAAAPGAGIPSGTVAVSGGASSCTINLSGGSGSCVLNPLFTEHLTAGYSGDGNFNTVTGTEQHDVIGLTGASRTDATGDVLADTSAETVLTNVVRWMAGR